MTPLRLIAIGDLMTEAAGPALPHLAVALREAWPGVPFDLVNLGRSGTRAGLLLWRLTHDEWIGGRLCPSVVSLQPDIVLVESCAHVNAADGVIGDDGLKHFRDMHWRVVATLREKSAADLVEVVTLPPDGEHLLETAAAYVHTPAAIRRWMAKDRRVYLEEAVRMAQAWELPLANVYQAALDAMAKGVPLARFIAALDWQQPSEEGHRLTARIVVEALRQHHVVEERLAERAGS